MAIWGFVMVVVAAVCTYAAARDYKKRPADPFEPVTEEGKHKIRRTIVAAIYMFSVMLVLLPYHGTDRRSPHDGLSLMLASFVVYGVLVVLAVAGVPHIVRRYKGDDTAAKWQRASYEAAAFSSPWALLGLLWLPLPGWLTMLLYVFAGVILYLLYYVLDHHWLHFDVIDFRLPRSRSGRGAGPTT